MEKLESISQGWERYKIKATYTPDYKTETITITEEEKELLRILKEIKGFPVGHKEDAVTVKLLRNLEEEFPGLNRKELIKNWAVYKHDQPFKKRSSPRAQLRNQFKMASQRGMYPKISGSRGEGKKYGDRVSRYKG